MANFQKSKAITHLIEGGYVNDPIDPGKETYKGISRRYWPNWKGWKLIDSCVKNKGYSTKKINQLLEEDNVIQTLVDSFYKENFWDKMRLDEMDSQSIANEVYDTAINLGIERAVQFLQIACNLCNDRQRLYSDLRVDGDLGSTTLGIVNTELKRAGVLHDVLTTQNLLQGAEYINLTLTTESKERFFKGWIRNRIIITTENE